MNGRRIIRILGKTLKYTLAVLTSIILVIAIVVAVLYFRADMREPQISVNLNEYPVIDSAGVRFCGNSMLQHNSDGLWELYLEGSPVERGVAFGRLADSLLYYQETVFVDQIKEIIPSESYLKFLRTFIVVFNRNLGKYIPEEFREEIFAMSQSCSPEYNYIGTPYERQLNFHAAHDIGHTMQEYMLVGCSSFGAWNSYTVDSSLIIGRNFDFYVGDGFAKNKIVMFVDPDKGHKYASVSWAGMVGVLSGMNDAGLTVTLNAAKGSMPTSAAMPISLLAREILQYASTIDEAYAIAAKRHTFVSESLLIGSAKDNCAAIIEKSPTEIGLYCSPNDYVISTNHYQSDVFKSDPANIENIKTSDSQYRFERMKELILEKKPIDGVKAAAILRNRMGLGNRDIGLLNEKSVNQSIGHHTVIFQPKNRLMWVSTSPWQSGKFVCYNLNEIFAGHGHKTIRTDVARSIAADSAFITNDYPKIIRYRSLSKYIRSEIKQHRDIKTDSIATFVASNPNYFGTYDLLGDYYASVGHVAKAKSAWTKALQLEIPRLHERNTINKKINKE